MKRYDRNSKKIYVLLTILSIGLIIQSCQIEGNPDVVRPVSLPGKAPNKITSEFNRHNSRPEAGMTFTGKREREVEKKETDLQGNIKKKYSSILSLGIRLPSKRVI